MKFFSFAFAFFGFGLMGCSSAKPAAVVRSSQNPEPATTTANSNQAESKEIEKKAASTEDDKDKEKIVGGAPAAEPAKPPVVTPAVLALTSSAFANMGAIPALYVAKNGGGNQSPPLAWANPPAGTASFTIQMIDLDFQTPPLIHWLITNIPATSTGLPTAIPAGNNLAAPKEAIGANQPAAYRGPNPPALHRYEITVYAIKAGQTLTLSTDSAKNKTELEGKSLSKSSLIGTYQ